MSRSGCIDLLEAMADWTGRSPDRNRFTPGLVVTLGHACMIHTTRAHIGILVLTGGIAWISLARPAMAIGPRSAERTLPRPFF